MSYKDTQEYLRCIEPLTAEETRTNIVVSAYPNLKKDKAKKIEKEISRRTQANLKGKNVNMTTKDIYHEMLRTLGNG